MSDDADYYRQRALAERALAQAASEPDVATVHNELARRYEALVEHAEPEALTQVEVIPPAIIHPSGPATQSAQIPDA